MYQEHITLEQKWPDKEEVWNKRPVAWCGPHHQTQKNVSAQIIFVLGMRVYCKTGLIAVLCACFISFLNLQAMEIYFSEFWRREGPRSRQQQRPSHGCHRLSWLYIVEGQNILRTRCLGCMSTLVHQTNYYLPVHKMLGSCWGRSSVSRTQA